MKYILCFISLFLVNHMHASSPYAYLQAQHQSQQQYIQHQIQLERSQVAAQQMQHRTQQRQQAVEVQQKPQMQASKPAAPIVYDSEWRQAEFEKDQEEFLASGARYKNIIRSTGTECGGSYGHWFYKKLDGSVTHSFDDNSGLSDDERDAWLFQAYEHHDSIERFAGNGWPANYAHVADSADSLLKKMERDVTTPEQSLRNVTCQDGKQLKVVRNNQAPLAPWLAERMKSQDEGPLFQQLFVGLWRKRDKTLVAAISDAQRIQEGNRARGAYLNREQNKKIAEQAGCDCKDPECSKTKWRISRFENAVLYEDTIRNRKLPSGIFPAWIQMQQGNFRISKSALPDVQQTQGTLLGNLEKAKNTARNSRSYRADDIRSDASGYQTA